MRHASGREARLARQLEGSVNQVHEMRDRWREEHEKVAAIAQLHMPKFYGLGTHPLDLPSRLLGHSSPQAKVVLWCEGCGKPWPCKTYQLACDCPPFTVEFTSTEEASHVDQ